MRLLFDIGNTRVKWACLSDGELLPGGEFVHRNAAAGEIAAAVAALPAGATAAAGVNVGGGAVADAVAEALQRSQGIAIHWQRTAAGWRGLRNGYADPGQLGVDRWAAMAAAWHGSDRDVCLVDAGTAVTIDLVRRDGSHLGGVILPGLGLMQSSLIGETADIGGFAAGAAGPGDPDWFGRSTREAVSRGAVFSLVAAIRAAVAAFPGGADPRLVLTGGDAARLAPRLGNSAELRPLLVLEGLALLSGDA